MKTAIVMEGGALRTIYSAGVCDALLDADLMPDYFVGVSAGAAYGVSYLSRQKRRNLQIVCNYANDRRYMGIGNLLNPKNRSYFGLDFSYREIPDHLIPFDYDALARYPGEAEAVVTNLDTGRADYLPIDRGHDPEGILQATCAMPLLFPIYHIHGQPYLDGGCADPIPYQRAFDRGCDRVVVILTRERSYVRRREKTEGLIEHHYRNYPNFVAAMRRRTEDYNRCRERLFQLEREGRVLVLSPESTAGYSRTEKDVEKIRALWQNGYFDGRRMVAAIRTFWGQDVL
ncbi:patatin-like phospholipase family protein [Dysosmobacter sp.]|uniref:patatin-like phospholipase family protein n=1 Tax=Dysosmobacter sp. TaxID=2591382 RepID=UPI002A8FD4B0|nr:patatin family protein [Dysosmobacter sp.]MDY3282819.1 patatin family protein [Dysosmobacter sp.]